MPDRAASGKAHYLGRFLTTADCPTSTTLGKAPALFCQFGDCRPTNHHHHTHTSTRRPSPATQTPQASLSTFDSAALHTPTSNQNRTSKKRRVDASEDATTTTDTRTPTTSTAAGPPPANSTKTSQQTSSAQALVEVLTSQLEALIQTLSTLLTQNLDTANINLSRAQTAIQSLANSLPAQTKLDHAPKHTKEPPHRTPTYAAAASAKPNAIRPHRRKPTDPHAVRSPRPTRPQDSRRVIVDLDKNLQSTTNLPSPHELRNSFNHFATQCGYGVKALAAEFTKANNLAVTMAPPIAAKLLLDRKSFLDDVSRWAQRKLGPFLKDEADLFAYSDDKWHRIVVHGIPILDVFPGSGALASSEDAEAVLEKIRDEITGDSNPWASTLRSTRFIVPSRIPEDEVKYISACLAFPDWKAAQHLLREGIFLFGKHCRTSVYKSKNRLDTPFVPVTNLAPTRSRSDTTQR